MTYSLIQDTTIVDEAKGLLPSWLQQSQNLLGLIGAIASQYQLIENAYYTVYTGLNILTSTGAQLDLIGRIIGLARIAGQSDGTYQSLLLGWISNLQSNQGQAESLITILKNLYAAGTVTSVNVIDIPNATFQMTVDLTTDPNVDAGALLGMSIAKAAGINLILQKAINPSFRYKDTSAPSVLIHGFEDQTAPGGGGNFASLVGEYV